MNTWKVIIIFLIFLTSSICVIRNVDASDSYPSVSEIESKAARYLRSDLGEKLYMIENVSKVDGFFYDESTYIAYINYDMLFNLTVKDTHQWTMEIKIKEPSSLVGITFLEFMKKFVNFEKGDRISRELELVFVNTEKGWIVRNEKHLLSVLSRSASERPMEELNKAINSSIKYFSWIYRQTKKRKPELEGNVILRYVIYPSGKVESVQIISSEIEDKRFIDGIVDAAMRVNFGDKKILSKAWYTHVMKFSDIR